MTWQMDEWIKVYRQMGKIQILDVPELLAQIWQRGQAAGLLLQRLYVLDKPLTSGMTGGYEQETGAAWVWLGDDQEGAARTLLYLLARAGKDTKPVTSIDDDVDVRQEIYREAGRLAAEWGHADLMPGSWVQRQCDAEEANRDLLHVAGELAGNKHPGIAHAALHLLRELAIRQGWDRALLEDAMYGIAQHETANLDVLTEFDRTLLRGSWSLFQPVGNFSARTIELTPQIGEWLRSALRSIADNPQMLPAREIGDPWLQRIWLIDLGGRHQLRDALAVCNELLLAHPEDTAEVAWWLYSGVGHESPRYYRLQVRYGNSPIVEVWMLIVPHANQRLVEGALQLYIQGWLRCTDAHFAPLAEGLQTLTLLLAGRETPEGA